MADRPLSTAPPVTTQEDATASQIHVIHAASNKLLSVGLLLSLVTKLSLGIDNIDNTADSDKPVSTYQEQAIQEVVDFFSSQLDSIGNSLNNLGNDLDSLGTYIDEIIENLTALEVGTIRDIEERVSVIEDIKQQLLTPTSVMPIALAKIASEFVAGPAFSFRNVFDDMLLETLILTLDAPSTEGDTVFDLFVDGVSVLSQPLTLGVGITTSVELPLVAHSSQADLGRLLMAGETLSGAFTSIGTGVRTPVLMVKWRKTRPADYLV